MTKMLVLMRHGHYMMHLPTGNLSEIGNRQADDMGYLMASHDIQPDGIYHSIRTRTIQTATRMRDTFNAASGLSVPLFPSDDLTNENFRNPVSFLNELDDTLNFVIAVTHQPIIENASRFIADQFLSPDYAEAFFLESKANSWRHFGTGTLIKTLRPF